MSEQNDDSLSPGETFRILGNETRFDILCVLSEALQQDPPALSFTDLRQQVGISKGGNFDYHLDQLRGTFIQQTQAGYSLRPRGLEIVGTVLAGTLTDDWREASVVSGECLFCSAPLTAQYSEGRLTVHCTNGHAVMSNVFPTSEKGQEDLDRLVALVDRLTRQQLELARMGTCSNCYGKMNPRIETGDIMEYRFHASCERCGMKYTTTVGMALVRHPAVVAFYHDHERDITAERLWTLEIAEPDSVQQVSTPESQFRVSVRFDDEVLELTLDETGSVTETTRILGSS